MAETLHIEVRGQGLHDITTPVREAVQQSQQRDGVCHLFKGFQSG
jgi:thiamine phosphate synthase YjbQ (UPF0047 family)